MLAAREEVSFKITRFNYLCTLYGGHKFHLKRCIEVSY